MKYYLIAGEKSGDLHGANLIKALQKYDSQASFRCFGGDEMQKSGASLTRHYSTMSFIGFVSVLLNLHKIKRFLRECETDILQYQPHVVILIDYAGFNLRMAEFAKKHNFTTFYYISPKVWAWNTKRAWKIKKVVDRMFCIMTFEKAFYQKFDYQVDYIGNPLFDAIQAFVPNANFYKDNELNGKKIIAILAGSRKSEVKNMLPLMVNMAKYFPNYQFVVAGVTNLDKSFYQIAEGAGLKVIFDQTYDLLHSATAALVASGTATLETALFNVPQVVCYKSDPISMLIAWFVLKIDYISLINLSAEKEVVKELLQYDITTKALKRELEKVLGENRARILLDYQELRKKIRTEASASETAAKLMWKYLTS
jgi:lipid-A-disaccharide synthase